MYLEHLRLSAFRNISALDLEFSPGVNLIFGNNGQGKTNLLESIALLAHARSFRTSRNANLTQHGQELCSVLGEFVHKLGKTQLAWSLGPQGRKLFVNESEVNSLKDFLGQTLVLVFSPLDIELIKGSPSCRRKFLDRHACQLEPTLLMHMIRFNHALKSKNSLLHTRNASRAMILALNRVLAEEAQRIWNARQSLLELIGPLAGDALQEFARNDGVLEMQLETDLDGIDREAINADSLEVLLEEKLEQELKLGRTLFGPQRDELKISLLGSDARQFASQGQSRSIVLALLMAASRLLKEKRQEQAILLLDDLESELDQTRNKILLELVANSGSQVLITGTSASCANQLRPLDLKLFSADAGCIKLH